WLEFNGRVLALAEDASLPLLARVRFLSIFRTNLDEFFMVRVAALKRALQTDDGALSDDGLTAREQLDAIVIRLRAQLERYAACWLRQCLPALGAQGVRVRGWSGSSVRYRFASPALGISTWTSGTTRICCTSSRRKRSGGRTGSPCGSK